MAFPVNRMMHPVNNAAVSRAEKLERGQERTWCFIIVSFGFVFDSFRHLTPATPAFWMAVAHAGRMCAAGKSRVQILLAEQSGQVRYQHIKISSSRLP